MNITVIGSHLCPDTLLALCKLREAGIDVRAYPELAHDVQEANAHLGR